MFSFLRIMAVKRKPSAKKSRRAQSVSLSVERLEDRLAPALPTVMSVTSTDAAGTYGVGATIPIDVNFTGSVTVTSGTPTLTLTSGATVNYFSGSGSATLVFDYLVAAPQTTGGADLNATALSGMISDKNNSLTSATPLTNSLIIIDAVAPTVTSVSSTNAAGSYGAGAVINISVNFSKPVVVTGTPTLNLNSGGTASYASGSGNNTLTFTYTVGVGDSSADLNYTGTGALKLSGGTIQDTVPNDPNPAVLTLPGLNSTNALAPSDIDVDAMAPTVTSVSSSDTGSYGAGAIINVSVNFSKPVDVNTAGGTPTLALNSGGTASYASGTGTSTLLFTYTVGVGDSNADLNYTSTTALALNGATIQDTVNTDPNTAVLTLPGLKSANALAPSDIDIDAVAPTVTSVSSSDTGSYGAGAIINVSVNFSKPVDVNTAGGTPTLNLNSSGTASYAGGTGTSTLTFTYTVAANDSSADLNYTGTGALKLNGATIQDTITNNPNTAVLTLPGTGSPKSLAPSDIDIDGVAPTVTSVSSSDTGSYGAGAIINISVNFSKPVNVNTAGGTPTLALNSGGTASYASGTGTSTLLFTYTVGVGDSNADLNYTSTTALALNGATIQDTVNTDPNTAVLTLPGLKSANALAPSDIDIDAVAPTVTSVSSSDTGSYGAGAIINVSVNFSKPVDVNTAGGTPTLNLNSSGTASYAGGTGTSTLTFTYTVAANDSSADLNYTGTGALKLNGATIQDTITNNPNTAVLTLPGTGSPKSLAPSDIDIDGVAPTVTSVSSSDTGSYGAGAIINISVNFSKPVNVNTAGGTPTLALNSGGTASYASGTGTSTLLFTYTVGVGDSNADLNYTSTTALALNGATIQDTVNTDPNTAVLTLPGLKSANALAPSDIDIDAVAPTVTSVSSSDTGSYGAGAIINVSVNFSKPVDVNTAGGTPTLNLNSSGTASYAGGTGTSTLTFTYTVAANDSSADLNYTGTGALKLNGATIQDTITNNPNTAVLTLPGTGSPKSLAPSDIDIDGVAPTVTSVSSSDTGSYGAGAIINISVNFSKPVNVNTAGGTPTLALNSGGTASYASGTGTSTLLFTYTVGAGDSSADLNYTSTTALALNGATIQDTVNTDPNTAVLTLPGLKSANALAPSDIDIDAIAPTVTNVTSTTANSTYGAGATINVNITFSKVVNVTGVPQLALNSGGTATYTTGTGTDKLTFSYTVLAGQNSADLDAASTGALTGTINNTVTNNPNAANLTVPVSPATNSLGVHKSIVIDAIAPTVTSVSSTNAASSYGAGATIDVTVNFSKAVNVTGTPLLALNTGVSVNASYTSGSGTSTLTFMYTVAAGQSSPDLDYSGTGALSLNGGTIQDTVPNDPNTAVLTLPTPGTTNALSASDIVIDAVAPTVTSVSSTNAAGSYGAGATISVTVNFSKKVVVTGTPLLALNTGVNASYATGSGTSTLKFTYTVAAGQTTAGLALDYTSMTALALNGGTIQDTVANDPNTAVLTLPAPGAASSLAARNIVIDAVAPTVTNITSSAANGSYGVGLSISITITFSKAVNVTGTPQLALNSGGTAYYTGGTGSNMLTFTYTVLAGQMSAHLDAASTAALTLNGGTIKDTVTNDPNPANLMVPVNPTAGALGLNKSIVIDTVAPTVLDFYVLYGTQKYDLIGSTRRDLPWQITGIEVVFSKAIYSGDVRSLTGVTNVSFTGLGTTTLTWNFNALANGTFPTMLLGSGFDALKDVAGNKLYAGAGFAQSFKVLIDDVNGDGVFNAADLAAVASAIGTKNIFADVNGDGVVNEADFLAVYYALEKEGKA